MAWAWHGMAWHGQRSSQIRTFFLFSQQGGEGGKKRQHSRVRRCRDKTNLQNFASALIPGGEGGSLDLE